MGKEGDHSEGKRRRPKIIRDRDAFAHERKKEGVKKERGRGGKGSRRP